MTLFEYLSVAVSIVLSLSLIRLIGGLRLFSESGDRNWISVAWIAILIGLCLTHWWTSWSFRVVDWTFSKFVLMLAGPAILYALATIVVPEDVKSIGDWSGYISAKRVPLYSALMVYMLVTTFDGYLMVGAPLFVVTRLGAVAAFFLAALGLAIRKPGLDVLIVILYGILLIVAAFALLSTPDSITLEN